MTGRIPQRLSSTLRTRVTESSKPVATAEIDDAAADFSSLIKEKKRRNAESTNANGSAAPDHDLSVTKEKQSTKGDQSGSEQSEDTDHQDSTFGLPSPDTILRSMTGHKGTQQVEATNDVPADMNAIVHQVAEDVMVSEIDSREVRISIKDSILPETEVRLVQDGGRMQVRFVTTSSDSLEKITQHQNSLQTALNERIPGRGFVVSVEMDSTTFSDHRDGQSRGKQDQHQHDDEEPDN